MTKTEDAECQIWENTPQTLFIVDLSEKYSTKDDKGNKPKVTL